MLVNIGCELLSDTVWKNKSPLYNSHIIHPTLQISDGYDQPNSSVTYIG